MARAAATPAQKQAASDTAPSGLDDIGPPDRGRLGPARGIVLGLMLGALAWALFGAWMFGML